MALIRFAEGQQRSGSMGATVYSHNRSGAYIRARSVPVNPNTQRQIDARVRLTNLAIRWNNTLTQVQRDAWELYAMNVAWKNKLGDTINLTGLNMYLRSNGPALQAGLPEQDDAPTLFTLATAEASMVVTASEAPQTLEFAFDDTAPWASEDGAVQLIYMGAPQNAGIKFFKAPFRLVTTIEGQVAIPPTSPVAAIPTVWPFAADQRIWVRSRILRADGRLSEYAGYNFLGVA